MAASTVAARVSHGDRFAPRSPTLSMISMILPDGHDAHHHDAQEDDRGDALNLGLALGDPGHETRTVGWGPAHSRGPLRGSPHNLSSSPISLPQTFHDVPADGMDGDAATQPRRIESRDADALPSSPTVQDALVHHNEQMPRRHSDDSSSISSDDLEHLPRWPGLDVKNGYDDSGVDLEDDEEADQFPGDEDTQGLNGVGDADGLSDPSDKHYTSDLYSRRAEIILANAKKRLNVRCECNHKKR